MSTLGCFRWLNEVDKRTPLSKRSNHHVRPARVGAQLHEGLMQGEALLGSVDALPYRYFPVTSKAVVEVRRAMLKSSAAQAWRA